MVKWWKASAMSNKMSLRYHRHVVSCTSACVPSDILFFCQSWLNPAFRNISACLFIVAMFFMSLSCLLGLKCSWGRRQNEKKKIHPLMWHSTVCGWMWLEPEKEAELSFQSDKTVGSESVLMNPVRQDLISKTKTPAQCVWKGCQILPLHPGWANTVLKEWHQSSDQ